MQWRYPGTYTLCLKKVPTFKLFVTLSSRNWFSKFLHCWKAYEMCYKTPQYNLHHLGHVATHYLGKLKILIFCKCSMEENANKLHFKKIPTFKIRLSTSLLCTASNTNFLSKSCPRCWIPCWMLTNTAVPSAVTNFRCHKMIAKVKLSKQTMTWKILFAIGMGNDPLF